VIATGSDNVKTAPVKLQPLGFTGLPSTHTVNRFAEGSPPANISVIVKTSEFPVVPSTADLGIGGPVVERFADVIGPNDSASLPAVSCTAKLLVASFDSGAAYETSTICVEETTDGNVRTIDDPETERAVGTTGTPSTETKN
jgi:hypothetical protein